MIWHASQNSPFKVDIWCIYLVINWNNARKKAYFSFFAARCLSGNATRQALHLQTAGQQLLVWLTGFQACMKEFFLSHEQPAYIPRIW